MNPAAAIRPCLPAAPELAEFGWEYSKFRGFTQGLSASYCRPRLRLHHDCIGSGRLNMGSSMRSEFLGAIASYTIQVATRGKLAQLYEETVTTV